MPKYFRNNLLTAAFAMTPFLLTACGDDPNTNNTKFESAAVQVVATPATASHLAYQALLLGDK